MAIFTLTHYILKYWLKQKRIAYIGALLASIIAIALYTSYFYTAVYPNQLVGVWLVLLTLSISLYERRIKGMGYCMAILAFVTTMTHPTYALMAALFIGLFFAIRIAIERKELLIDRLDRLTSYAFTFGILLLGPARTITFPSRMSDQQIDVGSFAITKVFGLSMKQLVNIFPVGITSTVLLLLSLLGTVYIVKCVWRSKQQLAIVLALLLFYPIIMYVPPVFTILHKVLPLWVIDRFAAMDVLAYILVFLGTVAVCAFMIKIVKKQKHSNISSSLLEKGTVLLLCAFSLVVYFHLAPSSYARLGVMRQENSHYYSFMSQTYLDFKNVMGGEKTVLANQGDSYLLGAILPINVLAIEAGHMSPAASADNRIKCQAHLLRSFDYADLQAAHISLVAISTYSKDYESQHTTIKSKPYLKLIAKDANFSIYKVGILGISNKKSNVYQPCEKYQKIENS
jgi:hypothetical protein